MRNPQRNLLGVSAPRALRSKAVEQSKEVLQRKNGAISGRYRRRYIKGMKKGV